MSSNADEAKKAREYGLAAQADGWSREPTYNGESADRAAKLTRDGFQMQIISREYGGAVSIWGPDGLSIKPPDTYDFAKIKAGLLHCNKCDADGVETEQYSFAGRCCKNCLPAARKKHEYPGWTN